MSKKNLLSTKFKTKILKNDRIINQIIHADNIISNNIQNQKAIFFVAQDYKNKISDKYTRKTQDINEILMLDNEADYLATSTVTIDTAATAIMPTLGYMAGGAMLVGGIVGLTKSGFLNGSSKSNDIIIDFENTAIIKNNNELKIGTIFNDTIHGTSLDDTILGGNANSDYTKGIQTLFENSVEVAGYVYSNYGKRSILEIQQDIWFMKTFYPKISYIFIDETSGLTKDLSLYKQIADYSHSLGLKVIFNTGTAPETNKYFDYADILVAIEDSKVETQYITQAIENGVSPSKIAALGYSFSQDKVLKVANEYFSSGAKYVYITEDGQNNTNPWDSITSTFDNQKQMAIQYNSKMLIPLYSYPTNSSWDKISTANDNAIAIINPNNGPQTGDDILYGFDGNDILYGFDGDDILYGGSGNNILYGGSNTDTVCFAGKQSEYKFYQLSNGFIKAVDSITSRDGTNILSNIEIFKFSDIDLRSSDLVFNLV